MIPSSQERLWRFRATMAEDSAFFEGHFPQNPILPAIGQVQLLLDLMRQNVCPALSILGIESLRLQKPILPGDEVLVSVQPAMEGDTTTFRMECGDQVVSRGRIRWNQRLPDVPK